MSDNHERFPNESESVSENVPQTKNDPETTPNQYGSTYRANSAPQSYTWNNQTGEYNSGPYKPTYQTPPTYSQPMRTTPVQPVQTMHQTHQVKKKQGGTPFAVKLLAVALCCALTSAATLGVFTALVKSGTVQLTAQEESSVVEGILNESSEAAEAETSATPEPQTTTTGAVMSDQDIAEKLIPSVVCVQNYQVTEQYGFMYASSATDTDISPAGEGSGIIIREDGYIVTNAHVIDGATSLKVILYDGSTVEAELVGSDELTDLAVIKIDVSSLTDTSIVAADFGSAADMRVADKVMAIGNPGGYELNSSVTIGYVSALNRTITNSTTGYTMEYIQTDAAINPGNSGGALVNSYGEVIGINSAKISATAYEGLGFAIPSDFAQPIIEDLIEYGYVKDRAMLGISGQYLDALTGRFYGLPQGEYVAALNTEAAQASGLQLGDVITAIDGTELTDEAVLRSLINAKKPGETVTLTVYRPSIRETAKITLTLSEYSGG